MRTTNLPPQAYTKNILNEAFLWLKTQPEEVKSKATTTDAMVSYYLRFKRSNKAIYDSASADAFKNDLKNLSKGFDEFENLDQAGEKVAPAALDKDLNEFEATFVDPVLENQEKRDLENSIKDRVKMAVSAKNTYIPASANLKTSSVAPSVTAHEITTPFSGQAGAAPLTSQPTTAATTRPQFSDPVLPQPQDISRLNISPDLKTQMMIEDTLNSLNLSTKDEAIRVLIGLGYGHIKGCFPKN